MFCANNSGVCPSYANIFTSGQSLATLLKPFPFQGVSDGFAYVANSNYNSLQATVNMRASHGLTFMANYTWSRAIDDGGTFRSGYAIPGSFLWKWPGVRRGSHRTFDFDEQSAPARCHHRSLGYAVREVDCCG